MNFYKKEKQHNIYSIIFSVVIIAISLISIYYIIEKNLGFFLLFIPISIAIFGILKIIRSLFLTINLQKMNKTFLSERMNMYVYENWHKKLVGNFWIWLIFFFLFIYSFLLYTIFFFSGIEILSNFTYWKFAIITFALLVIAFAIYKINYILLSKSIKNGSKNIENIDDYKNELKMVSISVKDDYKNLMFFIICFFTLISIFLLFSTKFRNFYKNI